MKRLHAAALAATLAAAAPAWAAPPAQPAGGDQTITLTKDGKPHRYTVLKTYRHPTGGTAYDVKDAATGDVMTVVENASPEQVKATLKPPVTTEVKAPLKALAASPALADPLLQPKLYAGDARLQKKVGVEAPRPADVPAGGYTREPVPAAKRWFGWKQKDAKPAPQPQTRKPVAPAPANSGVVVAAYHPDPVFRLIACLRDDLLPSMREVAAVELVSAGRGRTEAVEALAYAARTDPAPSVRACCARCLGELHAQTPECLAALKVLENDRDESVRVEAHAVRMNLHRP